MPRRDENFPLRGNVILISPSIEPNDRPFIIKFFEPDRDF